MIKLPINYIIFIKGQNRFIEFFNSNQIQSFINLEFCFVSKCGGLSVPAQQNIETLNGSTHVIDSVYVSYFMSFDIQMYTHVHSEFHMFELWCANTHSPHLTLNLIREHHSRQTRDAQTQPVYNQHKSRSRGAGPGCQIDTNVVSVSCGCCGVVAGSVRLCGVCDSSQSHLYRTDEIKLVMVRIACTCGKIQCDMFLCVILQHNIYNITDILTILIHLSVYKNKQN